MLLVGKALEVAETGLASLAQIDGLQVEFELSALQFAEVEQLAHQPLQDLDVLQRQVQELRRLGVLATGTVEVTIVEFLLYLFQGCRNERQRRAEVMAHVGEEGNLRLGGLLDLLAQALELDVLLGKLVTLRLEQRLLSVEAFAQTTFLAVVAIIEYKEQERHRQQCQQRVHQRAFEVELLPVGIGTRLQHLHRLDLVVHFAIDVVDALGRTYVDERRGQHHIALERFAAQDLHCRLHYQVTACDVGGRHVNRTVSDGFDAIVRARQAIHAHDEDLMVEPGILQGTACPDGHLVVLCQYHPDVGMLHEHLLHLGFAPVALPCTHALHELITVARVAERFDEALMTQFLGRRAYQAHHLEHLAASGQHPLQVLALQLAHLKVVAAHESRIFVARHLSVGHNHGNACIECLRHGGRERVGTVGRNHEQIDALTDEVVDVARLALVVVVGRTHFEGDTRVEQEFAAHLLVEFGAPGIVAALRDADVIIHSRCFPARHEAQGDDEQGQKYNNAIKMSFHDGIVLLSFEGKNSENCVFLQIFHQIYAIFDSKNATNVEISPL